MAVIATPPKLQFFDANGAPLVGGKLYSYAAGTTTPQATYTDAGGVTPNANPIILDSRGEASVWLGTALYKFKLTTSTDVEVWTVDNVGGFATLSQLAASGGSALVGFLQAGTGAVARTVQSKLRDTVSVKDFGAVGDGVADDTAAIQAAMNSAAYVQVLVPPGTYRVTSTLSVTTQLTLTGPEGGSQEMQHAFIYHDPASTGTLFSVTTNVAGVCLKNFRVTGGNGSFCITSSNSYVRYEYIYMQAYNGGGIRLLSSGIGSSSSKLANCTWVGPASATSYTGFEIDVNGGDVLLDSCTAIRGAIGINIIQGQTIVVNRCSLNKQTRNPQVTGGPYSSASQFNTAGIRLSGGGYKEAISIRNCYLEAIDNTVYVEGCESLTIEDNLFQDVGAAGNSGAWTAIGNSAINLLSSAAKNVTIKNNRFLMNSNGTLANPFYGIYFNSGLNVLYLNNYYEYTGDYSGEYSVGVNNTVWKLANTTVVGTATPVANADAGPYVKNIVASTSTASDWFATTAASGWTNTSGRYKRDELGYIHLSGYLGGGSAGTIMTTLPSGFRPAQQESFAVNASGVAGVVTVATNGQVSFTTGTGTFVYLSNITFSTT
jgi:hypothetical protein